MYLNRTKNFPNLKPNRSMNHSKLIRMAEIIKCNYGKT